MQLRNARVCLDCEELHEGQQCPVCASEMFAFLTRWVPVDDRRSTRRVPHRATSDAATRPNSGRWVKNGIAGVALVAASRWLWRSTRPAEAADALPDDRARSRGNGR